MDEPKPNEPTPSFRLAKPQGKLADYLPMFVLMFLGIIVMTVGLTVGLTVDTPYKIHCQGNQKTFTGRFSDKKSANAKYLEKTAKGMTCTKEYQ